MQCLRCQHDNPANAKFCLECGARLALSCTAKARQEMQAQIDSAAGTIWQYLKHPGEVTRKLKQGTKLSDQLLFAGIDWLTREEKLNFTTKGRSVSVCLREHKPA